jgi:putative oxidoreductase
MAASLNVALLVLRVVAGLTLAGHGAQKLFGWFGGPGVAKMSGSLRMQGFKPAGLWTAFVVIGEVGGGLSLALGLLTPLGAAGAIGAMFMAIAKSHWKNGFWNSKRGIEFPLQLLAIGVALGIAGPGDYALDSALGLTTHELELPLFLAFTAAALVVDLIGLAITRNAASPAPAPAPAAAPAAASPAQTPAQTPGSAPSAS